MSVAGTNPGNLSLGVTGAAVLWCAFVGAGSVATKIANGGISPLFQAGLRSVVATVLVLTVARLLGRKHQFFDRYLGVGVLAGVFFALEFWALFVGLNYTTVARGTLFLYTAPFFVAPVAHFVLPNDKLNRNKVLGLVVAFIGLLVAFSDRLFGTSALASGSPSAGNASTLLGDLLCMAAAAAWGLTSIIMKATSFKEVHPEKGLVYQLATSAVILLAASLLLGEKGVFAPSAKVWLAFSYQAVVVCTAAYLLWFYMIQRYSASLMHAFTFLAPIFGVAAGGLILNEPIGWNLLVALVLVASGLILVNRPTKAK